MKAHITNLGLENFRVFKEKTDFEFAPITILTGTNSSGKSSLINALDILNNYSQSSTFGVLPRTVIKKNTRNPFTSSKNWINKDSNTDIFSFETKINIGNHLNVIPFFLELEFKVKGMVELSAIRIKDENENQVLTIVVEQEIASCYFFYHSFLNDLIKAFLIYYSVSESRDSANYKTTRNEIISLEEIEIFKLFTKWINIKSRGDNQIEPLSKEVEENFNKEFFTYIPHQIYNYLQFDEHLEWLYIAGYNPNHKMPKTKPRIIPLISFAPILFQGGFNILGSESANYYESLKIIPEVKNFPNYSTLTKLLESGDIEIESFTDIYNKFHNFISGIFFESIKDIIDSYIPLKRYQSQPIQISPSQRIVPADSTFGRILSENIWEKSTNDFINKWLSKFNLGTKISVQFIEEIYGYRVGTDIIENIADFGFGMAKLIPLLYSMAGRIQNAYDPYSEAQGEGLGRNPFVLLLEEPEANLHPALQSKLADMFVDAARKFNIQFIIETHSEYLIRKLQYLTAKGEIKPEDTAIYYFYPPDDVPPGEEHVKRINIEDDGSLSDDFGTGFFDEADKIAMSIWNMNKSQKN